MVEKKEEKIMIVPLSSARLKRTTKALSNETAVKVLERLLDGPMSATELADTLSMPLTTVKYSVDTLLEAELIKVDFTVHSQKGREMKYYVPVKKAFVFVPEKEEETAIAFLKKAFLAVIVIGVVSVPVALVLQNWFIEFATVVSHEVVIVPERSLWAFFTAGSVFAVIAIFAARLLSRLLQKTR